ncbi:MAG: hypothetical protein ACR2L1_01435 [Pyrinomonadaceae bacterium]
MDAAVAANTIFNPPGFAVHEENAPVLPAVGAADLTFEIGVWLSGLESFLNIRNHSFAEDGGVKAALRDWTIEFRLTHSTLLRCSKMVFQLEGIVKDRDFFVNENDEGRLADEFEIGADDVYKLSQALKEPFY